MSQSDFGNLSSPLSGTAFFDTHLEPWRDALHSSHSGASRPSYAVNAMFWVDTTTTPYIYYMFDGTDDIKIGEINATTNQFVPANTGHWGGTAGGTANALTLTPTPALGAYAAGVIYDFIVGTTNTAEAPTINISGKGARNLKYNNGSGKVSLPIGALQGATIATIIDDGTDAIVINVRPHNPATAIAAAATINLDNATGDYVSITGTTTATAITLKNGQQVTCVADAAFILTNGASLILPGGANITTAAGDSFVVRGEASGVVRVVNYMRADGTAITGGGGRVLLETQDVSNVAQVDFTSFIDGTYKKYEIEGLEAQPITDNARLYIQTSTDGGATFDSGASDYLYSFTRILTSTIISIVRISGGQSEIEIAETPGTDGWSNAAGETFNFILGLMNPSGTTNKKSMKISAEGHTAGVTEYTSINGMAARDSTADIDAVRIKMHSGNISGLFKLYGIP